MTVRRKRVEGRMKEMRMEEEDWWLEERITEKWVDILEGKMDFKFTGFPKVHKSNHFLHIIAQTCRTQLK